MKNALGQFTGKEIYGCKFLGTRLNLNPYSFSLCHEAQTGDRILGSINNLSPEEYYESLKQLVEENQNKHAPCHNCDKERKYIYKFEPINYITIGVSGYCNSSCVYCQGHFEQSNEGYDPIPLLEPFHREKLLDKNCYFDWGGGEPTLNPWFEKAIQWIQEQGYRQRINTNAILYSKATEEALIRGNTDVRISVDSGSRECFQFMKGNTQYNEVWKHIRQYCTAEDKVYIKYNICNYNSDFAEIEKFIEKCKECNVKHIIIDAEVNSYQPTQNAGPFYFTEKEFKAAHHLQQIAECEKFDVQISGYAFSVRAEYDENNNLKLPAIYYDNMDYNICSNNIKVQTFPNIRYMINHIKANDYPVAVWGGRDIGKMCIHILQEHGIMIENIIDNDSSFQNKFINGIAVKSAKEYFSENLSSQIILSGRSWKNMLGEINRFQYENKGIYYLPESHYYSYFDQKIEQKACI